MRNKPLYGNGFRRNIGRMNMGLLLRNNLTLSLYTVVIVTPGKYPSFSNKRSPMVNPVKNWVFRNGQYFHILNKFQNSFSATKYSLGSALYNSNDNLGK